VIAVIFEVTPVAQHKQTYLGIAADLRPMLDGIEGFISIERFASLSDRRRSFRCRFGAMRRLFSNGGTPVNIASLSMPEELECLPTTGCVSLRWFVTTGSTSGPRSQPIAEPFTITLTPRTN
jgi:hypothetical protein